MKASHKPGTNPTHLTINMATLNVSSPAFVPALSLKSTAAPSSLTWSYLEDTGQVQGPFQSDEMLEWSTAGYLSEDLMVMRSCDQCWTSLADLTKLYSRVPSLLGLPLPL